MKKNNISSIEKAAKELGVSVSALKSIMSDRGKPRYCPEKLQLVLMKIGYPESGEPNEIEKAP